ncbi:hypothetical protein HC891_00780 [Candidatus Gracilibacteria bacterium]|nr:hypothetical protein [Candidatus Gracilibacteria bacterium]
MGPDLTPLTTPRSLTSQTVSSLQDFGPVVASDGENFLVAWERVDHLFPGVGSPTAQSRIVTRLFNSGLSPQTVEAVLPIDYSVTTTQFSPRPRLSMAATWIGDAYRVLWVRPDGTLRRADFSATGALIADSVQTVATNALTATRTRPASPMTQSAANISSSIRTIAARLSARSLTTATIAARRVWSAPEQHHVSAYHPHRTCLAHQLASGSAD